MRNSLVGIVIGAIIGGLVGYAIWGRASSGVRIQSTGADTRNTELEATIDAFKKKKPRYAVIKLQRSAQSARCTARIDFREMGGYPKEKVKWSVVEDEKNPCRPDGPWAVWVVFTGESPLARREMRVGRSGEPMEIRDNAEYKNYTYKVEMRDQHGLAKYVIIDPDLEVEPPNKEDELLEENPEPPSPPPAAQAPPDKKGQ